MNVQDLKTWPEPFAAIVDGSKKFEYRLDDRGFMKGDKLLLREYLPVEGKYTGQWVEASVTYVVRGPDYGVPLGFCVMSIAIGEKLIE